MAPKRKATSEPDSEDPTPYHVNFPLYPEADLVVETSDGVFFATRALFLRAASSVFDDILGLLAQEDKKDGLPLIKVEEVSATFEVFLRYVHRERHLVDGQPPSPSWSTTLLLSILFDKYDSPLIAKSFLVEHLPRFIRVPLRPADQTNIFVQGSPTGETLPSPSPSSPSPRSMGWRIWHAAALGGPINGLSLKEGWCL